MRPDTPFPGRRRHMRVVAPVEDLPPIVEIKHPEPEVEPDQLICPTCGKKFEHRRGMHFHTRRCKR